MRRTRGFTLIELMVSMALFGLIAAGAMSLVLSGARMQSHSARVDVAQAGLRTAIDFITRDVLMTSACATSGNFTKVGPSTFTAIDFTPSTHDNVVSGAPYASTTDILELYNVDGTTVGQVATASSGATSLTVAMESNSSAPQFLVPASSPYPIILQVCDLTNAAIVSLSSATATTLTLGAGLPAGFGANAYVMPSRHVRYYVTDTLFGTPNAALYNTSMLMMEINGVAQPLAEGVEDMQIAYGFDNNGDGNITENGTAGGDDEWLFNVAGETIGAWPLANLRKVRVTLIVKSTSVDSGQTNFPGRPKAEDHAASATTTDGFVRRVLRTEIGVRNFTLSQ